MNQGTKPQEKLGFAEAVEARRQRRPVHQIAHRIAAIQQLLRRPGVARESHGRTRTRNVHAGQAGARA